MITGVRETWGPHRLRLSARGGAKLGLLRSPHRTRGVAAGRAAAFCRWWDSGAGSARLCARAALRRGAAGIPRTAPPCARSERGWRTQAPFRSLALSSPSVRLVTLVLFMYFLTLKTCPVRNYLARRCLGLWVMARGRGPPPPGRGCGGALLGAPPGRSEGYRGGVMAQNGNRGLLRRGCGMSVARSAVPSSLGWKVRSCGCWVGLLLPSLEPRAVREAPLIPMNQRWGCSSACSIF